MPGIRPCVSCGSQVSAGARFCANCGADVSTVEESVARSDPGTNQITCPACGGALSPENKFCPSCGAARPEAEAATIQSQVSLKKITAHRLAQATAGEFEILQLIGYGAMGSVYLARDIALSRRVAIKVVSPALLVDDTMIARFRLEAQTVASLRHPNIVNIHGVRQFSDLYFFVMDFIDGPSLRTMMKAHGALDIAVAQALLFEVGSALSYAHRRGRGVIHRDVKPANIMVDREGHAVVMDFGISKVGASEGGLTQTGATIGTPEYMSPQQCRDEELTGASDQYALGIVAYEMFCGEVPFKGSNYSIMVAHASQEPPPIRDTRPDCPQAVEDAVMRMLKKSPEDRWPDLDSAVAGLGGHPLGHRDPIRGMIVELAESVIEDTMSGLDTASPLSPIPGMAEDVEGPVAVSITGLPETVEEGDTFELQAEVRGASGTVLTLTGLVWSTSDPSIVTIDEGAVEAQAPGSASITATVGTVANTVIVTVTRPSVAKISVLPSSIRMEAGGRISLTANVKDRSGKVLDRPIRWISDADHCASISDQGSGSGEVMALTPGTTKITAEVEGVTGTAEIIIEEAKVRQIVISGAPSSIQVGEEFRLEATLRDAWDASLDREIAWASDASDVVTVEDGLVTAVGMGTARIQATSEGKSATVFVKVSPAAVASIEVSGLPESSNPGDRFKLAATLRDRSGAPVEGTVVWSSSDESLATISAHGMVLTTGPGDVSFTCRSGDVEHTVTLVIAAPPVPQEPAERKPASEKPEDRKLAAEKPQESEPPAERPPQKAPAAEGPAKKVPAAKTPPTRKPRAPVYRKPSNRGRWIAAAAAVVAALFVAQRFIPSGDTGTAEITSVTLDPVADTLLTNDSLRLVALIQDRDGGLVEGVTPTWTSSDPEVATVEDDGLVVARAEGPATILAVIDGVEAAAEILVRARPPVTAQAPELDPAGSQPIETQSIETTPTPRPERVPAQQQPREEVPTPRRVAFVRLQLPSTSMTVGTAQSPGLHVLDGSGGGIPAADYQATWSSTDATVLAVGTQRGAVSARRGGQAYVVVSVNGVRDSVLVRVEAVEAALVAWVRIDGGDLVLEVGSSVQLSAMALDSGGRSLGNETIRWSSSDEVVASIQAEGGLLQAIGPGKAAIVASSGDMEGRITVTIEAPAPAAVDPPTAPTTATVPSVAEARVELERFLDLLTAGDVDAVMGLFGEAGSEERHRRLVDRMDEQGFAADLLGIDEGMATASGATVSFEVELSWRSFTGARRERTVEFRASLEATPSGWRLSTCVLAPGAEL